MPDFWGGVSTQVAVKHATLGMRSLRTEPIRKTIAHGSLLCPQLAADSLQNPAAARDTPFESRSSHYNTLWRAAGRHCRHFTRVKTQDTSETKARDSIGRKAPTYVDTYIMLPATPLEV